MTATMPTTDLDERFSSPGVPPTSWAIARDALEAAEIFWISTVRPDGRPHVTPLMAVLLQDTLYFCTGPTERKARNLEASPHVVMTTGASSMRRWARRRHRGRCRARHRGHGADGSR